MPSMYSEPCAKFTIRVTPKMSDRPAATRNRVEALASPFRSWMTNEDTLLLGAELPHFRVARQVIRAVGVSPRRHHSLPVLHAGAAHVGAHGRLMVQSAELD